MADHRRWHQVRNGQAAAASATRDRLKGCTWKRLPLPRKTVNKEPPAPSRHACGLTRRHRGMGLLDDSIGEPRDNARAAVVRLKVPPTSRRQNAYR